jgi:hypothetical protein
MNDALETIETIVMDWKIEAANIQPIPGCAAAKKARLDQCIEQVEDALAGDEARTPGLDRFLAEGRYIAQELRELRLPHRAAWIEHFIALVAGQ